MTTFVRGAASIHTAAETLASGRYRGMLVIETDAGPWQFKCESCRSTEREAQADADADIEYAYRRFLAIAAPVKLQ